MERLLQIREKILQQLTAVGVEERSASEAAGRYLAVAPRAGRALPPVTCSAMDGYAVRSSDLGEGRDLPVVATVYAGDGPPPALVPGTALRIFTGAPLPPGADAVVQEESVERVGEVARFRRPALPGVNVRPAGEDVAAGAEVLPAGTRLGARARALLSAAGVDPVQVHLRPRVAVVSTGDEIVRGRTPDSNGTALEGLVGALGCVVTRLAVGDDLGAVERAVAVALREADAVVTIGGVSVGERDHVPAALGRLGARVVVHGVPMKPGKPFLFAEALGRPVFGLPGSPSACLVAYEVFARPALLRLAGAARLDRPRLSLRVTAPLEGRPGRTRFLWATLDGDGRARPQGKDAAQVRGPALADVLLCIHEDRGDVAEGEEVEAWLLAGD